MKKNDLEMASLLAKKVNNKSGRAYFVGGFVRDKFLYKNENDKELDIDIEVHNITERDLINILEEIGPYSKIGRFFPVYKLLGYNIDIALPRSEKKIGDKHQDFSVNIDPNMGIYEACERRDFTINAIMQDILTGEFIDPFNGISDIENKTIRHVNADKYGEDPLRVLRAAMFAARFSFGIDIETIDLSKKIDLSNLSKERVFSELEKALLMSKRPSIFFERLGEMNHLNYWFPEIEKLKSVQQSKEHHLEGDVYRHTMMVLDEAANLKEKSDIPLFFLLASLCHDFGKIVSTEIIDGKVHAYKHEIKGLPLTKHFIKRLTTNKKILKYVLNMAELHMKPNIMAKDKSKIKSTNKMFYESISPNDLILLAIADNKASLSIYEKEDPSNFLYERYEIFRKYMEKDYVKGKDLIDLGIEEGEIFNDLLDLSLKHRLAGVDKKESLKQILGYYKSISKKYEEKNLWNGRVGENPTM